MKRTAAQHIAALEARIAALERGDVEDAIDVACVELRELIACVPSGPVYVGDSTKPRDKLEAVLGDVAAGWWDEHAVAAVFQLCERCGVRPSSRAPGDIEEAAESILLKYPR